MKNESPPGFRTKFCMKDCRVSAGNPQEISIYFDKYILVYNKYFLAYFWVENKYILVKVSFVEKMKEKRKKEIAPKKSSHKLISILTSINFCSVLSRTYDFM